MFFARIPDHLLQQVRDGTFRVFGGEIRDKQGKIQGYLEAVGREGLENAQAIINEFAGTAASALAGANLAVSVANLVATQVAIRDLKKTVTAGFAHMSSQFKSLNARHDLALYSELVAAAEVMRAAEYLPEGSGERSAQAQEALRLMQPAKTKLLQLALAEARKATELAAGRFEKGLNTLIGPPDEVARPLELLRSACFGVQLCALVRAEAGNLEGAQRLFDEDLEALQVAYLSFGRALFTQRPTVSTASCRPRRGRNTSVATGWRDGTLRSHRTDQTSFFSSGRWETP